VVGPKPVRFDLFVSGEVLNEIRRGDPAASQLRLQYVHDLLSREMGFEPPTIVTPEELTEP
jgi:hypothetical protein